MIRKLLRYSVAGMAVIYLLLVIKWYSYPQYKEYFHSYVSAEKASNLERRTKFGPYKGMVKSPVTNISYNQRLTQIKDFGSHVFLYSVVVGNSSRNASWDRLVFQGWEDRSVKKRSYNCCVLYESGNLQTFSMIRKQPYEYKPKMEVKQFVCPNSPRLQGDKPVSSTLSIRTCHQEYDKYLQVEFAYRHPNEIAICAKIAFNKLSAVDIIPWMEIQKLMGVSKVLMFTYHLNENASRVLEHYEKEGILDMKPFNLPPFGVSEVGLQNEQAYNDEQVVLFDCNERLKGYAFVAVIDVDEYIIPYKDTTWRALFERLLQINPLAAGFSFHVQFHIITWQPTNSSAEFAVTRYLNSSGHCKDRWKHVVIPDRLSVRGQKTHRFYPLKGYKRVTTPSELASLHHFRKRREEHAKMKMFQQNASHEDTSVARLFYTAENSILDVKSILFG